MVGVSRYTQNFPSAIRVLELNINPVVRADTFRMNKSEGGRLNLMDQGPPNIDEPKAGRPKLFRRGLTYEINQPLFSAGTTVIGMNIPGGSAFGAPVIDTDRVIKNQHLRSTDL